MTLLLGDYLGGSARRRRQIQSGDGGGARPSPATAAGGARPATAAPDRRPRRVGRWINGSSKEDSPIVGKCLASAARSLNRQWPGD
jgi:hypothetical protein